MIGVFALLCLVAPAAFGYDLEPPSVVLHKEGEEISYFGIPTSLATVKERNWAQSEFPPNANKYFDDTVTFWTNVNGKSFGLYIDSEGNSVGVNIAMDKAGLTDVQTDFARAGFESWKTIVNETDIEYYSTLVKYNCRVEDSKRVCDNVQFPGVDGELTEVAFDLSQNTEYTKQKCMDTRGIHRFYNMSSTTECSNIRPFYFLTDCDGNMIGLGFFSVAGRIAALKSWYWTVRWDETDIPKALEDGPACLTELGSSPGFEGFEMWHIANPQEFSCSSCA